MVEHVFYVIDNVVSLKGGNKTCKSQQKLICNFPQSAFGAATKLRDQPRNLSAPTSVGRRASRWPLADGGRFYRTLRFGGRTRTAAAAVRFRIVRRTRKTGEPIPAQQTSRQQRGLGGSRREKFRQIRGKRWRDLWRQTTETKWRIGDQRGKRVARHLQDASK